MISLIRPAAVLLLSLSVLTGIVYPAAITGVALVVFPAQASGSLIRVGDEIYGSEWIGQSFSRPEYFWGRLSATGPHPYNAGSSSGSNYGPLHPGLLESARQRLDQLQAEGHSVNRVPVDLVTASGSGLDPHISPAAAEFQVARVARARQLPEDVIRDQVLKFTLDRQFGLLGEPRVSVLKLNLALDGLSRKELP